MAINKENKKMLYFVNSIWRIRMKSIRSYSQAAFSVMLLLSCAQAQTMDHSLIASSLDEGNTISSSISSAVVNGVKNTPSAVSKFAANQWAKTKPARVIVANALNELQFNTVVRHPRFTAVGAVAAGAAAIGTGAYLYRNAQKNTQLLKAIDQELDATYNALTNGTLHVSNLASLMASLTNSAVKTRIGSFINATKCYEHTHMEEATLKALTFAYKAAKEEIALVKRQESS